MLGRVGRVCVTLSTLVVVSCATAFAQVPTCGTRCGVERWAIKTLTDSEAAAVGNATPQNTSVSALLGESAPAQLTDSRTPLEKERFHLTALIIGWKIESKGGTAGAHASGTGSVPDHDFHIVIADPQDTSKQMIMEVPDPKCQGVCSSKFLTQISQVRSEVLTRLGTPASSIRALAKPWLVEVTGPGFFDFAHGQDGLARNCIEIHPVMEIKFVQQQGQKVTPHKATDLPHQCGVK